MLARQVFDQRDFGFRDLVGINAGDADAFFVNMEHDLQRFGLLFVKDILQDLHDKLLSGVIVVMQKNFIEGRAFELFFGLGDQPMFGFAFPAAHDRYYLPGNEFESNMPARQVAILDPAVFADLIFSYLCGLGSAKQFGADPSFGGAFAGDIPRLTSARSAPYENLRVLRDLRGDSFLRTLRSLRLPDSESR